MRSVEDRLRSYEPLWENWTYTGEFLGEGAMSSVFEIQSTAMGMQETAALKIITVEKGPHGEVKIPESTLNEIKILRTLSSCPNIVRYHDSTQRNIFDKDNNLTKIDILIKMEKLQPLSEGSKLSEEKVIKLAKDMCTALVHAAEYGIIHRDIKPQNIFVSEDGTYKLGDFGISKIVSELSHHFTMNIGTLAYTAPEIQSGVASTYDISSDIYSLGLVLYVFLNDGYLPFCNGDISVHDAIAKRLGGAPFPSPSNGSKKLKSIVMRACSHDTVKRYSNPKEMLEDLELLSSGGKKYVPDPFATLDANLDISTEREDALYGTGSGDTFPTPMPSEVSRTRSGGLKINMSKASAPGKADAAPASSPTVFAPPITGSDLSEAAPKEVSDSVTKAAPMRSGLRINMKSSGKPADTESKAAPVSAPEEKTAASPKADSPSASSVSEAKPPESTPKEFASSPTKSSLRINLKGSLTSTAPTPVPAAEEPEIKEDTKAKDKDKDKDDFFFTPSSL